MVLEAQLHQSAVNMVMEAEAILLAGEIERHSLPLSRFPGEPENDMASQLRGDNLRLLYHIALNVRDGKARGLTDDLEDQLCRVKEMLDV